MSQASKVIKQAAIFEVPGVRDGAQKVLLVSPSGFATLATDAALSLTLPNGSAFKVPAGYIVRSAIVRASTNVAGNSIDLGLHATVDTAAADILDGAVVASVNLGLFCGQVLATATPIVATATDRYVNVTAKVADNTAGVIEVVLEMIKCDF